MQAYRKAQAQKAAKLQKEAEADRKKGSAKVRVKGSIGLWLEFGLLVERKRGPAEVRAAVPRPRTTSGSCAYTSKDVQEGFDGCRRSSHLFDERLP